MSAAAEKKEEEPRYVIAWDTAEIYSRELEYMQSEDYATEQDLEKPLTEDEAEERLQGDSFIYDNEWDYVLECLGQYMKDINPDEKTWRCEVNGFGWRNLNGWKEFDTMNPEKFLGEILPDTPCTFHIYMPDDVQRGGKMFYIKNYHHDSPMGESYYVWVKPEGEEEDDE